MSSMALLVLKFEVAPSERNSDLDRTGVDDCHGRVPELVIFRLRSLPPRHGQGKLAGRALLYEPRLLRCGRFGGSVRAGNNMDRCRAANSEMKRVSRCFDRDAASLLRNFDLTK